MKSAKSWAAPQPNKPHLHPSKFVNPVSAFAINAINANNGINAISAINANNANNAINAINEAVRSTL